MAARTRKQKLVKTGFIVEEFDIVSSGYGNITGKQKTPCQAIKMFCLECQGGHELDWRCSDGSITKATRPTDDVRSCPSKTCWLHPFKMGRSPNKAHHPGNTSSLTAAREQRNGAKTTTK